MARVSGIRPLKGDREEKCKVVHCTCPIACTFCFSNDNGKMQGPSKMVLRRFLEPVLNVASMILPRGCFATNARSQEVRSVH
jgi:hypothetical protein